MSSIGFISRLIARLAVVHESDGYTELFLFTRYPIPSIVHSLLLFRYDMNEYKRMNDLGHGIGKTLPAENRVNFGETDLHGAGTWLRIAGPLLSIPLPHCL